MLTNNSHTHILHFWTINLVQKVKICSCLTSHIIKTRWSDLGKDLTSGKISLLCEVTKLTLLKWKANQFCLII